MRESIRIKGRNMFSLLMNMIQIPLQKVWNKRHSSNASVCVHFILCLTGICLLNVNTYRWLFLSPRFSHCLSWNLILKLLHLKFWFSKFYCNFLNGYAKNFTSQIFSRLKKKQLIAYFQHHWLEGRSLVNSLQISFQKKGFIVLSWRSLVGCSPWGR